MSVLFTGGGNENYNCISVATLNGIRFCAVERGAHFSYGFCPEVYLLDITNLGSVKEAYYAERATVVGERHLPRVPEHAGDVLQTSAGR